MKSKKIATFGESIMFTTLIGCMDRGAMESAPDDESTSSAVQPLALWRADQNGTVTPGEGYWGNWYQKVYCNPGAWAIGYRMRVEAAQGTSGDDTALNSVQLLCRDPKTGAREWIKFHDGLWGEWWPGVECPGAGNYLKGARMRIEPPQGAHQDDTAANDVEFLCTQGNPIHAPGGQIWGSWGFWVSCPTNTAVCGFSIRFEEWQGASVDDTGMNGLQLECCNLP